VAAAGNGTTTTTGTTVTGVAKTQISQAVTITSVTATEYDNATDTKMKLTYQCAYLRMLATTYCVTSTGSIAWQSGIGITSTAVATRRGATITFVSQFSTSLITYAALQTAVTAAGTAFGTNLVTQLGLVNTATGYTIAVPVSTAVSAAGAAYATYDASGTQTSSASAIMPSLLTGMVALSAMLAM
jgi:hypothetical protein